MNVPQFTFRTLKQLLGNNAMFIWHGSDTKNKKEFSSRFEIIVGADPNGTAVTATEEDRWGFTWEEYVEVYDSLVEEWEFSQYQRHRQPEYPPLADLADALYWQSKGNDIKMAAYLAAVDAVKAKYPKGVE
jgi:hypothetical protein